MTLPLLSNNKRYIVTYDCPELGKVRTYSVWAATASIATARVTQFIDEEKHHKSDEVYYLIPRIKRFGKTNYDIF